MVPWMWRVKVGDGLEGARASRNEGEQRPASLCFSVSKAV